MIAHLRSCISILLLVLSLNTFAQDYSISGKVVDADNQPLSLVNVILTKSASDDLKVSSGFHYIEGTATNDDGTFKFEGLGAGTYVVRVSFIGFETFSQTIVLTGKLDLKTIQLFEDSESLDEVTIISKKPTVTRKPDRLIFNVENTALSEGSTLGVLKSTPGVFVSEGSINIKSASATVYINNRRVQLTSEELIQLLESAPANSIKSVEVITNPPASYEADSGPIVNIIMSKNLITGYRGSVLSSYTQGVFPRYNAGTSHYFKNNKINLNLNYSYNNKKINRGQDETYNFLDDTNAVEEIWRSDINRNTWSETHNLNLNFDYYIDDRNTLSITSTALYMPYFKYRIKNQTNIFDPENNFLSSFSADNLSRDQKYNVGTDLIFKHEFENSSSLTFDAHYTTFEYERNQGVFQDDLFEEDSEFNTLANQDTQIITGQVDYNLPIDETSTFDAGVKFSNVVTESDITRTDIVNGMEVPNPQNTDAFKYDENVFAAYTNYSTSWDKWELNIGLRAEQTNIEGESASLNETNTQDYLNWFPNVSLLRHLSDDVNVYSSYKRSISRPSYTNLNPFTFFINENTVVLGNPNLVPTYRDHYKIGVNFLKYFTVEAYYMNYDGDIVELPRQNNETNVVAFTPVNLDKKVDYGFDFLFDYYGASNWNISFVTSVFNISEETDFGEGFVSQNIWSNYSELTGGVSLLKDGSLNINLSLVWLGKNLQQFQTIENRLFSELSISKSVFNKRGVISIGIEDLFNLQDYEATINYLNQSNNRFNDIDNRFVRIGFRYNFGNTKLNTNERETDVEERDRLKDLN
ncbi:TonB-dependent receptor domain-containing protein [Winogradskyella tangerina]|uniref:TonB-dependent receptor domain-containing protein n=1 Tax=Winogradskyella tangerina TaxID=2023240 RepID=UPI000DBE4F8F|nr:outer membrane beta-barrel family protein [Winogradskyella tangerina]